MGSMDSPKLQAIIHQHQRGAIDLPAFRSALRELSGRPQLSDSEIDHAWSSQIGDVDCRKLKLIEDLRRRGFKVYMLSTTDPLHAKVIEERFQRCLPDVSGDLYAHIFEKAYVTFELGLLKPDVRIYEEVLTDAGLKANQTLFLDDSLQNVLGAQKVGLYSVVIHDDSYVRWLPELLGVGSPWRVR
ncbi:MAG: HAD family phosphatase [Deltaproteobacteria bacterium]|nr:HAD family phosphatase [Deltaproteobacteria bacterium]